MLGRASRLLHRPVDGLRRRRGRQVDADADRPERRRRLPQRLAHREGEHQRRLADGLGPVDGAVLVGLLEQRDVEHLGHLREARQLVGARRLGRQPAAARPVALVPAQVLERQPAGALDVPALDLADVDQRRQAVADVVDDVDPPGAVGPGEPVHLDLGRGDPVGEVLERLTLEQLRVPVQALGAVVPGGEQLDPAEVGGLDQLVPRDPRARVGDAVRLAVLDPHVGGGDAEAGRGDLRAAAP